MNIQEFIEDFNKSTGLQLPNDIFDHQVIAEILTYTKRWIPVSEQEPPSGVEVLAKSPEGLIHLINWRPAYKIFACQNKEESTYGWSWKTVE